MASGHLPRPELPEVYAIANCDGVDPQTLLDSIGACLASGARVMQLRAKSLDRASTLTLAQRVKSLCVEFSSRLIINDDAALAAEVDADGVHVGRNDLDCGKIRREFPQLQVIGVSCYNSLEHARLAVNSGSDYIAFGSVFPSPTKPEAPRCDLGTIEKARAIYDLPIVAIGGITPENASEVVAAGADYVAVISGIFEQPDASAATRRYIAAINPPLIQ